MKKVAVLFTAYNRKKITVSCLESFFKLDHLSNIVFDVFLVDDGSTDGSTDGTFEEISYSFPQVNIIKGDGDLFWNGGMRLAWNTAIKKGTYCFNTEFSVPKNSFVKCLC